MGNKEKLKNWSDNRYGLRWKRFSLSFGILLLIALSSNHFFLRHFVVLLLLGTACYEASWLAHSKGLIAFQSRSLVVMAASGIAYIASQGYLLKIIFFWLMIGCGLIYLYRLCYPCSLSWNYVKQMIRDSFFLILYYFVDLWRTKKNFSEKERDRKIWAGMIGAAVAAGILIALYALADEHFRNLLEAVINKMIQVAPIIFACVTFGIIPAMFHYSVIKGLYTDLVLENPRRNVEAFTFGSPGFYLNETTMKIIITVVLSVNTLFVIMQIIFLMDPLRYYEGIENVYRIEGILPMSISVFINFIVIALCEFLIKKNPGVRIHIVVFWDVISTAAITISIAYRYLWKVSRYGIKNIEIVTGLMLVLIMMALLLSMSVLVRKNISVYEKTISWITVLFVVICFIPSEYLISQLNVDLFCMKEDRALTSEVITDQDIDLEYLKSFKYQAVPALCRLEGNEKLYEKTKKSLGDTTMEYIIGIFETDLTTKERAELEKLQDLEEKGDFLLETIDGRSEYQIFGYKRQAYEAFKSSFMSD